MLLDSDQLKVDNFSLNMAGNSKINGLDIECVAADLDFGGSSNANVSVDVDTKLNITAGNSSTINLTQKGGNSIVNTKGSAVLNLNVNAVDIDIEAAGGSSTYISGVASMLEVEASAGSLIDAEALEAKEGNFIQSGSSKCHVNIEERMKVNLTGGCMLSFKRKPMIEVDRIVNSTLIKADDPKRK